MKAYTDIEQSKMLAGILSIESADGHYVRKVADFMGNPVDGEWSYPKYGNPNSKHAHYMVQNFASYEVIPCWSLAALLEVLNMPALTQNNDDDWDVVINDPKHPDEYIEVHGSNPVDACVEMILKLYEKKLL